MSDIINKNDLTLGDFQRLLETIKWISYSAKELVKELIAILNEKNITDFIYVDSLSGYSVQDLIVLRNFLIGLEIRLSEGIREDLVRMIQLKGLGSVKARTLALNGINNNQKLLNTPIEVLLSLPGFGPKLVQSIKEQVGQKVQISSKDSHITTNFNSQIKNSNTKKKNSSLTDFIEK